MSHLCCVWVWVCVSPPFISSAKFLLRDNHNNQISEDRVSQPDSQPGPSKHRQAGSNQRAYNKCCSVWVMVASIRSC